MGLGLSLTCVPWLAKNAIQTGNPVYPLAAHLFGTPAMDASRVEQWQAAHAVPVVESSGQQVASFGVVALVQSLGQVGLTSPYLSPTLIPLFLVGVGWMFAAGIGGRRWSSFEVAWPLACLGWVLWMLSLWWLATHRIDRFWLPILPLVAMTAGMAVFRLAHGFSAAFASSLVLLSIAYGALNLVGGVAGDSRFLVQLQALRIDAGVAEQPGRIGPATLWINQNLTSAEPKLLLIGEARVFDFEPPVEYATCFNENPGEALLMAGSPTEKRRRLRERGFTHVLVHWVEIERYRSPGNYGFSTWPQRSDMDALVDESVLVRVDWPFTEFVDLFKVAEQNPPIAIEDEKTPAALGPTP